MSEAEGAGRAKGPEGEIVRCGPTGRAQRIKTGGKQWSEAAEEKFFDILASCANVRMAARATGFTTFTVYRQRRIRPDFAARWQVALEQGYAGWKWSWSTRLAARWPERISTLTGRSRR